MEVFLTQTDSILEILVVLTKTFWLQILFGNRIFLGINKVFLTLILIRGVKNGPFSVEIVTFSLLQPVFWGLTGLYVFSTIKITVMSAVTRRVFWWRAQAFHPHVVRWMVCNKRHYPPGLKAAGGWTACSLETWVLWQFQVKADWYLFMKL